MTIAELSEPARTFAGRSRVTPISTSNLNERASSSATAGPLAIITGASGGLGLCIARQLAARGMRTVLIARSADKLNQHASALSLLAPSFALPLDLNDIASIAPALRDIQVAHGQATVLINNAGFGLYKPMLDLTASERESLLRVNLTAAIETTAAVLPGMLQNKQGHIINIASIAAKFGPWGHSVYAASKAGLIALTQSLSVEYPQKDVHFSYVCPGLIETDFFQEPAYRAMLDRMRSRAIAPEVAAKRIVKLLDRPKLEMCVPRSYRFIDLITLISPALTRRIIQSQSTPPEYPSDNQ